MYVSNENRHCPRCDAIVASGIVTPYFRKLIEFLTCRCGMLFSREVWRQ